MSESPTIYLVADTYQQGKYYLHLLFPGESGRHNVKLLSLASPRSLSGIHNAVLILVGPCARAKDQEIKDCIATLVGSCTIVYGPRI